ncbi:MAG: hypothetical protein HY301_03365 [Verrucomicrobia bacterium]|nr:hypothetical protein [Verrucomicrobiota bacterium]
MNYKFSCPQCGQHFSCTSTHAGTQIQCHACKTQITVPQPPVDVRPINSMPADATVMKAPPGHTWDTNVPKKMPPQAGNGLKLKPRGQ